ncbi:hypothetical protein OM170_24340, partial [Escherichia albertii]|nr:hypothetical protein [Escherichia albertii]MCZ9017908.1 hypothetical protein [Escherichia albertii]
ADATGGICSGSLTMAGVFCTSAPDSFKTLWKELEKIIVKCKLFFLIYFSESIKIKSNKQHKKSING